MSGEARSTSQEAKPVLDCRSLAECCDDARMIWQVGFFGRDERIN